MAACEERAGVVVAVELALLRSRIAVPEFPAAGRTNVAPGLGSEFKFAFKFDYCAPVDPGFAIGDVPTVIGGTGLAGNHSRIRCENDCR